MISLYADPAPPVSTRCQGERIDGHARCRKPAADPVRSALGLYARFFIRIYRVYGGACLHGVRVHSVADPGYFEHCALKLGITSFKTIARCGLSLLA